MTRLRSFHYGTCRRVLNLLKAAYLRFRKLVVKRIIVVKFEVNNGGGDGNSCFEIEKNADAASSKYVNVKVT